MQAKMSAYRVLFESLLRPFQLMLEPAILYVNTYIALAYAIFYREVSSRCTSYWFRSFVLSVVRGFPARLHRHLSFLPGRSRASIPRALCWLCTCEHRIRLLELLLRRAALQSHQQVRPGVAVISRPRRICVYPSFSFHLWYARFPCTATPITTHSAICRLDC